jgi:hypothetical protein
VKIMLEGLIGTGLLSVIIGLILLLLGIGGRVSADTEFGEYSGPVGGVLLVLGIVLIALGSIY